MTEQCLNDFLMIFSLIALLIALLVGSLILECPEECNEQEFHPSEQLDITKLRFLDTPFTVDLRNTKGMTVP